MKNNNNKCTKHIALCTRNKRIVNFFYCSVIEVNVRLRWAQNKTIHNPHAQMNELYHYQSSKRWNRFVLLFLYASIFRLYLAKWSRRDLGKFFVPTHACRSIWSLDWICLNFSNWWIKLRDFDYFTHKTRFFRCFLLSFRRILFFVLHFKRAAKCLLLSSSELFISNLFIWQ